MRYSNTKSYLIDFSDAEEKRKTLHVTTQTLAWLVKSLFGQHNENYQTQGVG